MRRAFVLLSPVAACSRGAGAGGPGPAAIASGTLVDAAGDRVGVATVVDPNLIVGRDGSADTSFALATDMIGTGAGSLLRPGGTALVIHAGADDERTDPSGNSGARVACAVLEAG